MSNTRLLRYLNNNFARNIDQIEKDLIELQKPHTPFRFVELYTNILNSIAWLKREHQLTLETIDAIENDAFINELGSNSAFDEVDSIPLSNTKL